MINDLKNIQKIFNEGGNILEFLKKTNSEQYIDTMSQISYDFQAGSYIKKAEENNEFQDERAIVYSTILNGLGEYDSIMEVGIGEGTTFANIMPRLNNIDIFSFGFDISYSRIQYAQKYIQAKNINSVELFTGNFLNAPILTNSVDIVYSNHSLEPNRGKELEILSILGYDNIDIIDANFGILDRDNDVLRIAADLRDTYGYPHNVFMYGLAKVKVAKKEKILDTLYETNFMSDSYNMALQSIDDIVLTNIKRTDITLEENLTLARKYKDKGVKEIKVELILGLPGSTLDIFYKEMDLFQEFNSWFHPRNIMTILPDSEFAQKEYTDKYNVKTAEVGTTENEEGDIEYTSNSIITQYRSSLYSVIETYSYTVEDWKEMFFMNRAQRVLGPLIPADKQASIFLKEQYESIKTKSWFEPINKWLNMLINDQLYDQDIIMVDGKESIEEIVRKNLKDIS